MVDHESNPKAAALAEKIPSIFAEDWMEDVNFDAAEWQFVRKPFGALKHRQRLEASWLIEGMAVLAWAIGVADLPPFHRKIHGAKVSGALGIFRPDARERVVAARLRNPEEIEMAANTYAVLLWRINTFLNDRKPMDLYSRLKDPQSQHLMVDGLEFRDNDLTINGSALGELSEEAVAETGAIVFERNRRFRWLLGLEEGLATVTMIN